MEKIYNLVPTSISSPKKSYNIMQEMSDKEYADYVDEFRKEKDKSHIFFIAENCVKRNTGEHMSLEEATFFYNDFVKELMLYHYPEDSDTLNTIILTYNYINRWK